MPGGFNLPHFLGNRGNLDVYCGGGSDGSVGDGAILTGKKEKISLLRKCLPGFFFRDFFTKRSK